MENIIAEQHFAIISIKLELIVGLKQHKQEQYGVTLYKQSKKHVYKNYQTKQY